MIKQIKNHFKKLNLDIRKTGDARFMDQKITPDVLSIISDCIINYISSKKENTKFTTKDIWNHKYSNENVKAIFNKPDVLDKSAKSEYDKFFQQPLKTLSYCKILIATKKGGTNFFKINNIYILKFISIKEKNALDFLIIYLKKILKDSDIWSIFEDFFINNNKEYFYKLKDGFENFIIENTQIRGKTEVRRIFTKIINPLAYYYKVCGAERGNFSNLPIEYANLMYNRRNWRDISKLKNETRGQYEQRAKKVIESTKNAYIEYSIQKAKNIIKMTYYPKSEVQDKFANDIANQVHHIFSGSDYPQISSYLENLILLTADQHFTHAHPNNNTKRINKDYQLICLIAKSKSIEKAFNKNEPLYTKKDFAYVLKIGLNTEFDYKLSFKDIREKLIFTYNKSDNLS